jgi:hypothetical protein
MNTPNDKQLAPEWVPQGYDSELLEALENPLGMGAREEDDDLARRVVRIDSSQGPVQPAPYLYP